VPAIQEIDPGRRSYSLLAHLVGFTATALLASYLADRVRSQGRELDERRGAVVRLQALNENIIESINSGLLTTDLEGRTNFLNRGGSEICGMSPEEMEGRHVEAVFGLEAGTLNRIQLELVARRRFRMERYWKAPDGRRIFLGFTVSNLQDRAGAPLGFIFIFQDLTEIKRLEREVRLKENLATMGEMAAGMAHEIRNPLASISGSVQVLAEAEELTEEQKRLMDIIVRESERLSGTLTEFLAYARPPRFEPDQIDLRRVLEETATLLRHSSEVLPEHRIALELPETPVMLFADPNQMKQITWNLARNALQAMPDGGRLDMGLARNGSGGVVMTFRDQGIGISGGEVHKVFEPFSGSFKRGSGLGLAIVYRIVKDYNGLIQVDSVASKGTVVSVHFPLDRRTLD
jgi:two-component system sensor histidine kinase PilS (NtrC family)